jgi:hypothetical protein
LPRRCSTTPSGSRTSASSRTSTSSCKLRKGNTRIDAIQFNRADSVPDRIRAAFRVDINEWNGTQTVQLLLEHFEAA